MRIAPPQLIDQVFSGEDSSRVQTAAQIEKLLREMNLTPLKVLSRQGENQIVLQDYKAGILHDNASLGVVAKQYNGELTVISMYAEMTRSAIGSQDPTIVLGEIGAAKTPVTVRVDYEHKDPDDCKNGIYIQVGKQEEYRVEVTVRDDLIIFSHAVA
ncbi:MAG: hypothetical protein O2962_06985, partial [Cyanobacteria bacterium]|nr:hypothetical protein [Cyanobacteriota bacterium]